MNMIRFTAIAAVLSILTLIGTASGQDLGYNGRLAGMGNSAVAALQGTDALGINPASIAPAGEANFSFSILPIGFHAGTDFIDFGTYQKYFTGQVNEFGETEGYYLTADDKAFLLNQFQSGVGSFAISGNYRILAMAARFGAFSAGFDMTDRIASNGAIPQQFVDFLFNGNPPGKTFDFSELEFKSSWLRKYGVSTAYSFPIRNGQSKLSVGLGVSLVQGYGYYGIDRFDSRFTTDPDSFVVYGQANMLAHYAGTEWLETGSIYLIQLFPDPVGQGIGFDIGVHADISPKLKLAASLTDIGSITWGRNAKRTEADEYFTINDVTSDEQFQELKDRINGTEEPIASFSTPLPTAINASAVYMLGNPEDPAKSLLLSAGIRQGFNDEPGNMSSTLIGLGTEWRGIGWLPLRAGVSFGGMQSVAFAFGLGLRAERFALDFGTGNISSAFSSGFSSTSFAITSHFDF